MQVWRVAGSVLAVVAVASYMFGAGVACQGAGGKATCLPHQLADLRRQPREPSVLAAGSDREGQLQQRSKSPGG